MKTTLLRNALLVGLIMFGFFGKAKANSPDYQVGQVWTLQSGEYKGAEVIIANVENHPVQKHVIHIMVPGPLQNAKGQITSAISHLPFSEEGLRKSDLKLSRKKSPVTDDWREGYELWNAEALEGRAGMFSVSVSEAIDFGFQQLPPTVAEDTKLMDPNDIAYSDYQHDVFSDEFLARIKVTTDAFEEIDGISYEQAIDLYRRDVDPESNIVVWEEMARVYKAYCENGCDDMAVKKDVYNTLLLASMFPKEQVMAQVKTEKLNPIEIEKIISSYALAPEPLPVVRD